MATAVASEVATSRAAASEVAASKVATSGAVAFMAIASGATASKAEEPEEVSSTFSYEGAAIVTKATTATAWAIAAVAAVTAVITKAEPASWVAAAIAVTIVAAAWVCDVL